MGDTWEGLHAVWGASFSDAVILAHSPAERARLVRCRDCGLEYFAGAASGNADFYSELSGTSDHYYVAHKWEFDFVSRIVRSGASLLDVGCGSGAFLSGVGNKVRLAIGIDTNADGIRQGEGKGLNVVEATLEDYVAKHPGEFDYVCAFQVLEHLPSVREFVSLAMSSVKPGGRLVLSVPNADRITKDEFEPLDCPPHHVSRWRAEQLQILSHVMGCEIETMAYEHASPSACRMRLQRRLSGFFVSEAGCPPGLAVRAISKALVSDLLYGLYRKLGLLDRWRLYGHSMVAVLRK